jgi:metal-responsive CopG/Arc/MetJ family transcriptional regulator
MPRAKVSITISEELLQRIDREASRRSGGSRSAVIEEWIRRGARLRGADLLREETIAYYDSMAPEDHAEDAAMARASGDAAQSLRYDD